MLATSLSRAQAGSQQLANGAAVLNAKSGILLNSTSQLATGAGTLSTKLADAANQIKFQPTGAANG